MSPELDAIATAAQVTHGTVRAILTRTETTTPAPQPDADEHRFGDAGDEHGSERLAA